MNTLFSFLRKGSENRTQFFIVIGFIILPVFVMVYAFKLVVLDPSSNTSTRLKIPTELLQNQEP